MMRDKPVSQAQASIVRPQANMGKQEDQRLPNQFNPTMESKSAGSSKAVATMKEM